MMFLYVMSQEIDFASSHWLESDALACESSNESGYSDQEIQ